MDAQQQDAVKISNVSVVRDADGKLSVWVGSERVIGASGITIQSTNDGSGLLSFAVTRFRVAEREPLAPMYETKDNVLTFPKLRAVQGEDADPTTAA